MRRALSIFVFLIFLGIGGMTCAYAMLTSAQDDVSFIELASDGDVTAADGLTISVQSHLKRHLLWNATHTFGQESNTKTDFKFSLNGYNWLSEYPREILTLYTPSDFGSSTNGRDLLSDDVEASPFFDPVRAVEKILRDVASRTENGERHTEIVYFKDYYDYYQLYATLYTEDNYYMQYTDDIEGQYITLLDFDRVSSEFNRYFRLPVSHNHQIEVNVLKDAVGNVVDLSTRTIGNPFWLYALSVSTDHGIYFTPQTGNKIEFSGNADGFGSGLDDGAEYSIDGGSGIYLLPESTIINDNGSVLPTLDFNNLHKVHSLDKMVSVLKLELSEDKSCLNLFTREGGRVFLTVFDAATTALRQKLLLFDNANDSSLHFEQFADGLMFVLLGDSRFVLAEPNDEGLFRITLSLERELELLGNEPPSALGYYNWRQPLVCWSGERLALISVNRRFVPSIGVFSDANYDGYPTAYSYEICGFVLEIFDESGLRYRGSYESTLDVLTLQINGDERCIPAGTKGPSAHW